MPDTRSILEILYYYYLHYYYIIIIIIKGAQGLVLQSILEESPQHSTAPHFIVLRNSGRGSPEPDGSSPALGTLRWRQAARPRIREEPGLLGLNLGWLLPAGGHVVRAAAVPPGGAGAGPCPRSVPPPSPVPAPSPHGPYSVSASVPALSPPCPGSCPRSVPAPVCPARGFAVQRALLFEGPTRYPRSSRV